MQNGETSEELAEEEAELDEPIVSITNSTPLSVPASTYPLWVHVQQALQEFTGKNLVSNLTLYSQVALIRTRGHGSNC